MSVKKLGFGLMRLPLLNPDEEDSIDIEHLKLMVDKFIERGFTYFDTAWMYCKFKSEEVAKIALVDRYPRDSFTLATKLHSSYVKSLEDRDRIFNEQRRKTGVEYFDYYLLHNVNSKSYPDYTRFDCFNWLKEKKEQGLARVIGCSCHDNAEFLDKLLTEHPELDFVQLQLNYLDWNSEGVQSRKCYETAKKHGKKVVVMEPVKGGNLAKLPESAEAMLKAYAPNSSIASWAVRFAASLDNVMVVLSGMSNIQQIEDNTGYMADFVPLNEEEQKLVGNVVDIINKNISIPCTACSYCTDGCPMKIAIPKYFSLYNLSQRENEEKWNAKEYYSNLILENGKASDCIKCGCCEEICPQHLPIRKYLEQVAETLEH